jgi:hypothetical protein
LFCLALGAYIQACTDTFFFSPLLILPYPPSLPFHLIFFSFYEATIFNSDSIHPSADWHVLCASYSQTTKDPLLASSSASLLVGTDNTTAASVA